MTWQSLKAESIYWATRIDRFKLKLAGSWESRLRDSWSRFDRQQPVDRPVAKNVFVSLTTWKPRLDILPLTLMTLVTQSIQPEATVVWLTRSDFRQLSSTHRQILGKWGVEFRVCDDLGSHKKWYFTRELGPDATVVLADDDIFYPKGWLQSLISQLPQDTTYLAHRCHRMSSTDGELDSYLQWPKESRAYGIASFALFATSGAGVAFQPRWIPDEFYDAELIQRLSPTADDVWLNCAMLAADIRTQKTEFFFPILGSEIAVESGLESENVHKDRNSSQMNAVLEHFGLRAKLLQEIENTQGAGH